MKEKQHFTIEDKVLQHSKGILSQPILSRLVIEAVGCGIISARLGREEVLASCSLLGLSKKTLMTVFAEKIAQIAGITVSSKVALLNLDVTFLNQIEDYEEALFLKASVLHCGRRVVNVKVEIKGEAQRLLATTMITFAVIGSFDEILIKW